MRLTRIPDQTVKKVKKRVKFIDSAKVEARTALLRSKNLLQMESMVCEILSSCRKNLSDSNTIQVDVSESQKRKCLRKQTPRIDKKIACVKIDDDDNARLSSSSEADKHKSGHPPKRNQNVHHDGSRTVPIELNLDSPPPLTAQTVVDLTSSDDQA